MMVHWRRNHAGAASGKVSDDHLLTSGVKRRFQTGSSTATWFVRSTEAPARVAPEQFSGLTLKMLNETPVPCPFW